MASSSSTTRASLVSAFRSNKATYPVAALMALILVRASSLANSTDRVLLPRHWRGCIFFKGLGILPRHRWGCSSVKVLGNSAPNLSPYVAQRGGLYLGPAYLALIPPNTTLLTSNYSWVDDNRNVIVTSKIPYVSGTVWAKDIDPAGSVFTMTTDQEYRYFNGNGLPSTPMGKFPVQPGTPAYPYYEAAPGGHDPKSGIPGYDYPNAAAIGVSPYNLSITVPRHPEYSTVPNPINSLVTGVSLTGTVWHVEVAAASSSAWYNPISILPLDPCWGHPYSEEYHLHGYSWKCFPNQGKRGRSPLFGYALDGFGIYGPYDKDGKMITNAQLDECHGMTSEVIWEGKLTNIYHYVLNNEYPYSIGCFRGTVNYTTAFGNSTMHSHSHAFLKLIH